MAEYSSQTIEQLIKDVESGKVVLPAIQRNFVWPEDKICYLFDSLMRDYPIGTFLFWDVDRDTVERYVFNKFISSSDEQQDIQRGEQVVPERSDYVAVLDGQQRITSLNIGIKGYIRTRIKGRRRDMDSSYVKKYLCINIMYVPGDEDERYSFAFKEENDIRTPIESEDANGRSEYWVKVSDVFDASFDASDYVERIDEADFNEQMEKNVMREARKMLEALKNAFFIKQNVNYFPARNKELSEVVDVFVRVNSGGQKLSASDLMLSVATGESGSSDIQVKMKEAIDRIESATTNTETGFQADKETILTAGLMFTGANSLSLQKKENYDRNTINNLMRDWDAIIDAICVAAKFIERIGFNGRKLTSKNLILPISYYFYKNPSLGEAHCNSTSIRARKDRVFVRQWLLRAMINSIFRDGTGSTLITIRNVINRSRSKYFPLDDLMNTSTKRRLFVSSDTIDDILGYSYGNGVIAPLLTELAKDDSTREYQVDHIWPKSKMLSARELRKLLPTKTEEERSRFKSNCHYLPNLQILEPRVNDEKQDMLFDEWVSRVHPDREDRYYKDNCIPLDTSFAFEDFFDFCKAREGLLRSQIEKSFPASFDEIVTQHGLEE